MSDVSLFVTVGLPFKRTIIVNLPTGRTWWTDISEFEVKSQVRNGPTVSDELVFDFDTFLTMSFNDVDTITVVIELTGEDTRTITEAGYYDVILSDVNEVDARAYILAKGKLRLRHTVTDMVVAP